MGVDGFAGVNFTEQFGQGPQEGWMGLNLLEMVLEGCETQCGCFVTCPGIRAKKDVGRFLVGVLTKRAHTGVVVTSFEELRTYT